MDTYISIAPKSRISLPPRHGRKGQTLVIVLSFLMLMMVLVLVFFGSVMTDSTTARASTGGVAARQLAQSAVQIVEGIITQATVPGADTSVAWASQPGMIRTYGSGGGVASSTPLNYYKLYSAPQMVVSNPNGSFVPDSDVTTNWNTQTAFYTDLNAPTYDNSNNLIYPIVDPRAQSTTGYTEPYPVQGFSYSTSVTAGTVPGVSNTVGSELLPMPVQWIYVLRDGTFASPTGGTGGRATFDSGVVTTANPIVGRIAFWTDDECSKINLNTASEGTYWDTPIGDSGNLGDTSFNSNPITPTGEAVLANNQPAQHEYQRYPGHPATTCLSTVFGSALGTSLARKILVPDITFVTPRYTDLDNPSGPAGGSMLDTSLAGNQAPAAPLQFKFNRLYSSVDDFEFDPSRNQQTLGNATATQTIIQQSRFFLTTSSKASELNLFGLPRIVIWPTWDNANSARRSTFDNEIVHCATVANGAAAGSGPGGGYQHLMEFTREDPTTSTTDANITRNQQLYGYLQALTSRPVPGFGGTFSAKYNSTDANGSTDINQILTEMFDYIRCTNLADQTAGAANSYTVTTVVAPSKPNNIPVGQVVPLKIGTTQGFGRIATVAEFGLVLVKVDDRIDQAYQENSTLPTPTYPASTKNLAKSINITPTGADAGGNTLATTSVDPTQSTIVEWAIIPRLFSPSCGYVALANNIRIHFTGISLTIGTNSLNYGENTVPDLYDIGRLCASRDSVIGGNVGAVSLVENSSSGNAAAPTDSMYPTGLCVVQGTNIVGGAPSSITIKGNFTATLQAPYNGQVLQKYSVNIPSTTVLIPGLVETAPSTSAPSYATYGTYRSSTYTQPGPTAPAGPATFNYVRAALADASNGKSTTQRMNSTYYYISAAGDTVRSVVPIGTTSGAQIQGDMRVVCPLYTVPSNAFSSSLDSTGAAPTAAVADQAVDFLRLGQVITFVGNIYGKTINLPASGYNLSSEVPVLPSLAPPQISSNVPADFDNGPGTEIDGPLINKADEGTLVGTMPYIGNYQNNGFGFSAFPTTTVFSPNRQISSPVMFGSLSAGLDHPWRTLLFRPAALPGYDPLITAGSSGGTYTHPGNADATIPDHLLLDLFRMPVVEPYCISEPLATSGQINLNTQIVPFTYITRTTGLRAVLQSVMMAALNPTTKAGTYQGKPFCATYKDSYYYGTGTSTQPNSVFTRYPLNLNETIKNFTARFANTSHLVTSTQDQPNFYVSASEVCDVPLVPNDAGSPTATTTAATLSTFWAANSMTGDNMLERPYSLIYPRVTTRSNVFTVHVRAQSLHKVPVGAEAVTTWTDGLDTVSGEYRGSFTVEKYFDPSYAAISTSDGTIQDDTSDKTLSASAAVRGDNYNASGTGSLTSSTLQHGALWRLIESKRFGE